MRSGLLEQGDKRAFIDSFRKVEHWFGDYARRFQNNRVLCVRRMTADHNDDIYTKSQLCWLFV